MPHLSVSRGYARGTRNIHSLVHSLPRLTFVNVSCATSLRTETVQLLARHCPKLETVLLDGLRLSDKALGDFARACPKLRKLSLWSLCLCDRRKLPTADGRGPRLLEANKRFGDCLEAASETVPLSAVLPSCHKTKK